MKKVNVKARILIALVALLIGNVVTAQPQGREQQGPPPIPTEEQVNKMVDEMSKELSLNEEQNEAINQIYNEHFKLVAEKQEAGRPDRSEMEALKNSLETDVKALLTETQKEEYTAYLKKQKEQRQGKKRARR
ncbi:hypothetical protein [Saccharicrinis aurantiacus]|uniref:hypothetical protein n=1 Tax=Saccharicrinis aurantiacus TaxID=1849719 RepID=UPI000837D38C|nr:hypothetical protein [Saccharicrinis aurantiacus]